VSDHPGRPREPPPQRVMPKACSPHVVIEFVDWTDLGPALPFETIPEWLRLPGEDGYLELDRYMRRASVKGGAG